MSCQLLEYRVERAEVEPDLAGPLDQGPWEKAQVLTVDQFHENSSHHHPLTQARLLYGSERLYVLFTVEDRYVRSTCTEMHSSVCKDSCVEFFVQPRAGRGYFNFEFNCGGTMLLYYIEREVQLHSKVDSALIRQMRVVASMPRVVDPEITGPVSWRLGFSVPYTLFSRYLGPVSPQSGELWRGNFYKCGVELSHPHWASWAPLGEMLSFHQVDKFAPLCFA